MNLNLQTDRLILRPVTFADVDVAIIMFTDPLVMRFVGPVSSVQQVEQDMSLYTRRGAGGAIGVWCVSEKSTGKKIGSAALLPMPVEEEDTNWDLVAGDDLPDADIEVAYCFRPSAWGQGYATESCRRLIQFAFEETSLPHVVGILDEKNAASWNVLEKSGLTHEGTCRAYAVTCPSFRITRKQWLAKGTQK